MKEKPSSQPYDVIVIGAGASGAALLYALTQYSTIGRIGLIEKYAMPGQVNSKSSNNSQTLHVGDIETNYSLEKVKQVYPAAMMITEYAKHLPKEESEKFIFPMPKMVLGVGEKEVALLEERYRELLPIFPHLEKLDRAGINSVEPAILQGRDPHTPLRALYTTHGYAVDFEVLAQQFIRHAQSIRSDIDIFFSHTVQRLERINGMYRITAHNGAVFTTRVLVVNADSYSLLLAKQLGYGEEFSLIPIGGSFYFSKKILNGKVYTVQDPKLPFAAVHGDPDIRDSEGNTRFGPTARFHPVLEARNMKTMIDFLRSSGLGKIRTWRSFFTILLDPTRFKYLLENMLYELPYIGTRMFIKNTQKIVPALTARDIRMAKGYGGMRLQRVNTKTHELLLGEGKIIGENAIFNMTPSPGASVSLYNALRDAETIAKFLDNTALFDKERMLDELYKGIGEMPKIEDVSQKETYAS